MKSKYFSPQLIILQCATSVMAGTNENQSTTLSGRAGSTTISETTDEATGQAGLVTNADETIAETNWDE